MRHRRRRVLGVAVTALFAGIALSAQVDRGARRVSGTVVSAETGQPVPNAGVRYEERGQSGQFLGWCEARGLGLRDVSPFHVAAYIWTHPGSAPTVKQHVAAIRMLGDWLVVSQVLPVNPAAAVRGPKHVVTKEGTDTIRVVIHAKGVAS